ncbi:hypothetical protein OAO09_02010 [Candidatus Pelagibacter sp.]|nr:hypothetical protein [Candidatus Pelagibacter sp.]
MIPNIFVLFFFYLIVSISLVGYGYAFERFFYGKTLESNIGYTGLRGIFFLILYSFFSHFFFAHGYLHNLVITLLGVIFFLYYIFKVIKKKNFTLILLGNFFILFIGIIIFKTHDDFSFYHFPYSYYITQNPLHIGIGLFNSGFKTPSSIFYLNSLFYLPIIKYYSFYIGTLAIMLFSNIILLTNIIDKINSNKINYIFYLSLLFFIFINIFFYRIQEHGTDRSAQILILILFLQLLSFINFDIDYKKNLDIILILLGIIISLKAFYVLYLILSLPVLFILYKKKKLFIIKEVFKNKIFYILLSLIVLILITYYLNSGCLIYPVQQTCFDGLPWSTGSDEVRKMNEWYQQWAKAGATPNFRVENPQSYIIEFNWVKNWFDTYFFNKVSDFLLGLLAVCLITSAIYFNKQAKKIKLNNDIFLIYLFFILLLLEWFINHPALRYGGYSLIAIIFFFPTSIFLSKINMSRKNIFKRTLLIILIVATVFLLRNINRINNEIKKYNYQPILKTYYRLNDEHFRIQNKFNKLITNLNNCEENNNKCSKELNNKIKKVFNNTYMFLNK